MEKPDLQPTLSGSLITLRPIEHDDWTGLFTAAADPAIWADHIKTDRHKEEVFRPYFDGAVSSGSALVVIENATGQIIGTSRFHDFKPDIGEIEIGWTFLAREFWGGKYNAEMKTLMLEHAFRFAQTVVFWVAAENIRSRRAMARIGGVLRAGTFSKSYDGVSYPYVVFEITQTAFLAGPLKNNRRFPSPTPAR
ncbi:MAG: GNAT family N-acetyltransferase [Pseudomonadota bacterium]